MVEKKLNDRNQNPFPFTDVRGDPSIEPSNDLNKFGYQRLVCEAQGIQDVDSFHKTLSKTSIYKIANSVIRKGALEIEIGDILLRIVNF